MNNYSSYTSIVFVAFGILYGAGFLLAAWVLVRKLMQTQNDMDQSAVKGTQDAKGRIATEGTPAAVAPAIPIASKGDSNKKEIEPPIDLDSGFDGGIDGGGI
ncbi:MAG: hypothetical protein OXG08_07370 [Gammaproteobacteria bacterium]|nr:hypothetical protein [Gammaproteobacteria bacterium]